MMFISRLLMSFISVSATFLPHLLHNSFAMEAGKEEGKSQQDKYASPTINTARRDTSKSITTSTATAGIGDAALLPDYYQEPKEEKKESTQIGAALPPLYNPDYYLDTKEEKGRSSKKSHKRNKQKDKKDKDEGGSKKRKKKYEGESKSRKKGRKEEDKQKETQEEKEKRRAERERKREEKEERERLKKEINLENIKNYIELNKIEILRKITGRSIEHVLNKHLPNNASGEDCYFNTNNINDKNKIEKIIEIVISNPEYYKTWIPYRGMKLAIKSKISRESAQQILGEDHVGFSLRTQTDVDNVIVFFNITDLSDITSLTSFATSFPCDDDYIPFYDPNNQRSEGNDKGWSK